jgi:hypothetical protein
MRLCGYFAVCVLLLVAAAPVLAQAGPEITETTGVSNAATEAPHAAVADAPATQLPSAVDRLQPGFGQDHLLSAPANRPDLPAALGPAFGPAPGPDALAALDQQRRDARGGLTWVIVGAALIGAGMLVDGDAGTALSVGGALIGVYGVYLMVRH